jgi:hypothetical protein
MAMFPYHWLTYVGDGEVALSSLLVDPVEAVAVLPKLPPQPAVFATVAAIEVVVVLVPVVVAVGQSGRHGMLQLRSWRCSTGVECRRSSRRPSGVQVDLL